MTLLLCSKINLSMHIVHTKERRVSCMFSDISEQIQE
jgi:hypothetical protein